jgi:hypothetical protein
MSPLAPTSSGRTSAKGTPHTSPPRPPPPPAMRATRRCTYAASAAPTTRRKWSARFWLMAQPPVGRRTGHAVRSAEVTRSTASRAPSQLSGSPPSSSLNSASKGWRSGSSAMLNCAAAALTGPALGLLVSSAQKLTSCRGVTTSARGAWLGSETSCALACGARPGAGVGCASRPAVWGRKLDTDRRACRPTARPTHRRSLAHCGAQASLYLC